MSSSVATQDDISFKYFFRLALKSMPRQREFFRALSLQCFNAKIFLLLPQLFNRSPYINYLTDPLQTIMKSKTQCRWHSKKIYNTQCGRLKAYWWNQASMKQDDVQDDVLSTRTLFKHITAKGLLVKPGFNEAGRCPGRCPINKKYTVKADGLLVKPDSIKQDDVL